MKIKKHQIISVIIFIILYFILSGCNNNPGTVLGDDPGAEHLMEPQIKENVYLEDTNFGGLKKSEVVEKIRKYAEKVEIRQQDAQLNQTTWEIEGKEKNGYRLNIGNTLNELLNSQEGNKVKLNVEEVHPKITEESLKSNIVLIGNFSTRLIDRQDSRMNNIEIASNCIDYNIISPGEEFSFNRVLGKRTQSKGYEVAPIIKRTEEGAKKGYGVGGGICQLSSTIFNAVEQGGLEVTERHIHSKDVGYVKRGRDATVSYGAADFKFRNIRIYPVMLRVYIDKNTLTVKVFENRNNAM